MARRNTSKSSKPRKGPRAVNKKDASIQRWETMDDIPMDEEDHFHASRDRILLDGEGSGNEDDGDEDEVFALEGIPDSSSENEGEDEEDEGAEDEDEAETLVVPSKSKKKAKTTKKSVATLSEEDDETDEEEDEESWGKKKSAYYSSNAAELESDDEEALEMEEAEARRLQAKARRVLADDDFGLGDAQELTASGAYKTGDEDPLADDVHNATVDAQVSSDPSSVLRALEKNSPETLALARDWEDIAHSIVRTQAKLEKLGSTTPDTLSLGMVHLHYQALLTYATTLAFYLHLRASPKYTQKPEQLRAHPVMQRLLTLKQSLATLEDLDFDLSDEDSEQGSGEEELDDEAVDYDEALDMLKLFAGGRSNNVDMGSLDNMSAKELQQLIAGETLEGSSSPPAAAVEEKKRKGKKIKDKTNPTPSLGPVHADEQTEERRPKKKRKANAEPKVVFDLEEPEFVSASGSKANTTTAAAGGVVDVYGEASALQNADLADKKARKKSLQFYTAKVASTAAKRDGARAATMGGDDDLPYKPRKRDQAKVKKSDRGQGGDDLDNEEPEPKQSKKRARDAGSDDDDGFSGEEDAEGYYSLVKSKSKEKKEKKKAEYDQARLAERAELEGGDEAAGPRSLTRAILKNKGLTPSRPKSVRNPRVKKRQRFEKAKKKVSSQRAVFKGGLAATGGRYEGEKTGISKVVKSTRL